MLYILFLNDKLGVDLGSQELHLILLSYPLNVRLVYKIELLWFDNECLKGLIIKLRWLISLNYSNRTLELHYDRYIY